MTNRVLRKIQQLCKKLPNGACLEGNIENLSYPILDTKIKDKFLHSDMKSSCDNGSKKQIINFLIEYDADINRRSLSNLDFNDVEMVRFLLELGIDINLTPDFIDNLKNPNIIEKGFLSKPEFLMKCIRNENYKLAKFLIEYSAECLDINHIDDYRNTALIWAVENNNLEMVELILKSPLINSKHFNSINRNGDTALILAAENNNLEMVELILNHPLITSKHFNAINNGGNTALFLAFCKKNLEMIKLILNNSLISSEHFDVTNDFGNTILILASHINNLEIVELVLNHPLITSKHFNVINELGETALIIAANNNNLEMVKLILNHPLISSEHLNVITENGYSALILAANNNNLEIIKLLLNHPLISSEHCDVSLTMIEQEEFINLINAKIDHLVLFSNCS